MTPVLSRIFFNVSHIQETKCFSSSPKKKKKTFDQFLITKYWCESEISKIYWSLKNNEKLRYIRNCQISVVAQYIYSICSRETQLKRDCYFHLFGVCRCFKCK